MTRRDFMGGITAASVGLACPAFAAGDGVRAAYAVSVLGDTHFDTAPESVYHSNYDESNRWAKIQHAEFVRNGEMWRERCPSLVAASGALAEKNPTRFVLQLGDLVQGDCDDAPTHRKMLIDCIRRLRAPYPQGLPFLSVMGNHDFRGKGARKAYLDFAESFMTREIAALTGVAAGKTSYPVFSFRLCGDLWVFCDFEERERIGEVCDLVEGAADARHVFLVTHGPFTPFVSSPWMRWRLCGAPKCAAVRQRLFEVLSRRRAVVLSGHTHTTNFYHFENKWGGFSEATVNTVWAKPELATAEPVHTSVGQYAVDESRVPNKEIEAYRQEVEFFRRDLVKYFYGNGAGHYRLAVAVGGVSLSFYPGAATQAARTFTLKG